MESGSVDDVPVLYLAILCDTVLHLVTLCDTVLYLVTLYGTMLYLVTLCDTVLYFVTLYNTVLHLATFCDAMLHLFSLYDTVFYNVLQSTCRRNIQAVRFVFGYFAADHRHFEDVRVEYPRDDDIQSMTCFVYSAINILI